VLWFAFVVNVVGVVLTAWLWPLLAPAKWQDAGPLAAVVYHQIGSLLVLLNSMRLLGFERRGSPAWTARMRRANDWLDKRFDLDVGLHWLGHHWRVAAVVAGVLVLLGYASTGLYAIQPEEIGLVRRFGRAAPDELEPGLHWRWPWPVEQVTRVQPGRVRIIEVGFRSPGPQASFEPRSWSSQHGQARQSDEAVMISGDNNLLEVQGSVRYSIASPRVFVFDVSEPDRLIRAAAEAVLRETVGSTSMGELLTAGRGDFQQRVKERLAARLREIHPDGLGVQIEGVSLHDLHPPQEVVQSYYEVTRAMELRDRRVNEAQADRVARSREQLARSEEVVRRAQAAKFERVRLAQARTNSFVARYQARSELSWEDWCRLADEMIALRQAGVPAEKLQEAFRQRRREQIEQQEALVDFRLYWESLTAALSGRPKMLIDSDKVPTRRSLWLVPFEPAPYPVPPRGRRQEPEKGEP
jgi:Cu+-exporting ATPase